MFFFYIEGAGTSNKQTSTTGGDPDMSKKQNTTC